MTRNGRSTHHRGAILLALACAAVSALGNEDLREELKKVPYKIVYETYRDGNWELYQINADGSQPVNLTKTPMINEGYAQVSRGGTKLAFIVDEGEGEAKARNVYLMNMDGTGRTLVAKHARYPFWNAAGTALCYVPDEQEQFSIRDCATKGLRIYDPATRRVAPHPNPQLEHLYNLCCTRDGKWILSTVHAGMGFKHAILAVEANGQGVFNLNIPGCRPDVSPDGKRVAWNASDFVIRVGDLDFSGPEPKVINQRDVVSNPKPVEVYQADWSPDGRHLTFTSGKKAEKKLGSPPEFVGVVAPGWNIFVADANATNRFVQITTDGCSNKEPDWVPLPKRK
jgi:TolB protein